MTSRDNDFNALARERDAFEKALPELLDEHLGEFAVFHEGECVALHPSYDSAYQAALEAYGSDAVFLIQRIAEDQPEPISISWEAGVAFG